MRPGAGILKLVTTVRVNIDLDAVGPRLRLKGSVKAFPVLVAPEKDVGWRGPCR